MLSEQVKFVARLIHGLDFEPIVSEGSRRGHINLKSADSIRETLKNWFDNVFIFSMNDEVIRTGFSPMTRYIIRIGVGVKS